MGIYDTFQKTATKLLDKYGTSATLRERTTGTTYNSTTGSMEGGTTEDYTIVMVFSDIKNKALKGSRITDTSLSCLISAEDMTIEPKIKDTIIVNGVEHDIAKVEPLSPGSTPVIYRVYVNAGRSFVTATPEISTVYLLEFGGATLFDSDGNRLLGLE